MLEHYVLAGFPIARSPSPAMHNAAFSALGIDADYALRPTKAADVDSFIGELRNGVWQGANITTPLKTLVAPHVQCDAVAARAGAVNTVWQTADGLRGALTDVDGVREPLREAGFDGNAEALVLGAGGAARAAVLALEALGCTVNVAARDGAKATALLDHLQPQKRGDALTLGDAEKLATVFAEAKVIVQSTPVGRGGEELPLPWERLGADVYAFEMLYLPRRTPFLQRAEAVGAHTVEGWQMLLAQGAAAFEIWTARNAPRNRMQSALLKVLTEAS